MKKTVVLLGVGSVHFTRTLIESMILKGGEWDIRMVDIDLDALEMTTLLAQRLVEAYDAPVEISGSLDRLDVLAGADAVVATIGVGGRKAWKKDVSIFHQFGVYQSTGDTYGAGGVSRALRTIPPLIEIARDIEKYCPNALFINFTNPLTVCVWAVSKAVPNIEVAGLCSGVTWYQHYLADLVGLGEHWDELTYRAIGPNHFTWITDLSYKGESLWPQVRKVMEERRSDKPGDPYFMEDKTELGNPYTWELFRMFDAFPCVGDGHISEFVPGWQGEGAYYGKTFGVDFHNLDEYHTEFDKVYEEMKAQAYGQAPILKRPENELDIFKDEDLFIDVLTARMGGAAIFRTVNLPNIGQTDSLPRGAVVEATTLINGDGFQPLVVGDLPPGITAIMSRILSVQNLTVEAALKADRKLAIQALIAGETVRTEAEAEKMMDVILETHRDYLPQFFE
jgi:alpha-galactosidase